MLSELGFASFYFACAFALLAGIRDYVIYMGFISCRDLPMDMKPIFISPVDCGLHLHQVRSRELLQQLFVMPMFLGPSQ